MRMADARLFLGLWPNAQVRRALLDARAELPELTGRPTHADDLHITLVFLGKISGAKRPCVEAVCERIGAEPFDLVLDRLGHWRRPGILWCGPKDTPATLAGLVEQLQSGLQACGFEPEPRPYAPHVTLARKISALASGDLDTPVHWPVRDFVLVQSIGGGRGPKYRVLRRWKLSPAGG